MSLDTIKLWRQKDLCFGLETTTATPYPFSTPNLPAVRGVTRIFNPKITFSTEIVERDSQGLSASPFAQGVGARGATAELESELVGSAVVTDTVVTQPIWTDLLRMCGMTDAGTAGTFLPVTNNGVTGTLQLYMGGATGGSTSSRNKIASGCMGSFKLDLKRGQKGRIAWNFMGIPQPVVDTAPIAPTYVSVVAPRCGAATFTVGGTTLRCDAVEIEKGNVLILREDFAANDTAGDPVGYRCAWITGWRTIIRIKPESLPIAIEDFYTLYKTAGTTAFACTVGKGTVDVPDGNTFALSAPTAQLITNPDEDQREGVMVDTLEFLCERNSAAGDDDFSITLL